jgi:hypothetical protein
MAYDINLEAGDRKVTFEDTKEGLFAVRFAPEMTGRAGATIVNADGAEGERDFVVRDLGPPEGPSDPALAELIQTAGLGL